MDRSGSEARALFSSLSDCAFEREKLPVLSAKRMNAKNKAARFSCIAIIYPRMFLFAANFIEVHWKCNWFVGSCARDLLSKHSNECRNRYCSVDPVSVDRVRCRS